MGNSTVRDSYIQLLTVIWVNLSPRITGASVIKPKLHETTFNRLRCLKLQLDNGKLRLKNRKLPIYWLKSSPKLQ